jgi:ceramide glucosyltransferase
MLMLQAICTTATICGIAYCAFCLYVAIRFRHARPAQRFENFTPPVSLLKPLCGVDPHIYESLRSHCLQDYPQFEIIFGVADPNDVAIAVVEDLKREFPSIPIQLVLCSRIVGMNFKVSNLVQMLGAARHAFVVINDSDICVPPDYLHSVMTHLEDRSVGLITCLYRGVPANTIWSRVESLAITTDFIPGVLAASLIESGLHFGFGSTLAFRVETLHKIGGLERISDYLADDYELGHRIADAGLRVELAGTVVDHYIPAYSFSAFIQHQLRWARTVRGVRPGGYASLLFTFALPWSVLGLLAAKDALWSWVLFSTVLALRVAVACIVGHTVLQDRNVWRNVWLLPLRDSLTPLIWIASYAGRRVVWRGKEFELSDGKLRHV